MKEITVNRLRCLHPRDLVVASIVFVVFTAAWVAGDQGFVGWTSFVLVPMLLAAYRIVGSRAR
jgi:hypothetical protein